MKKYVEMKIANPYMKGNGRSTRIWLEKKKKKRLKKCVDWSKIGKRDYMNAMMQSSTNSSVLKKLLKWIYPNKLDGKLSYKKEVTCHDD